MSVRNDLLKEVAELETMPQGAFSIRENGEMVQSQDTANINIVPKAEKNGIDIYIAPNTKNESLHMPVIITRSGISDSVVNDFHIGAGSDVLIVAGCGIHNAGNEQSMHNGIHTFYVEEGAKVRYVERHYGEGVGVGKKILNPTTNIHLKKGACMTMETTQIKGVDNTIRQTIATLQDGARLDIRENIFTHDGQSAKTNFEAILEGRQSATSIISRSVAENSTQDFVSKVVGNNECFGHVECDAILLNNGAVTSIPQIVANDARADLSHEAVVGKIAGEQIVKLMSLGLSEEEATDTIIKGFLK